MTTLESIVGTKSERNIKSVSLELTPIEAYRLWLFSNNTVKSLILDNPCYPLWALERPDLISRMKNY